MKHHLTRLRRRVGALITDNTLRGLAHMGRLHPRARPHLHQVRVLRDLPYLRSATGRQDPAHTLDIYVPTLDGRGPHPVVFYVHGGGFRILSKDTHWVMGLAFARQGYLVFNVNYRLAPRHPYPAALEDLSAALSWVMDQAPLYGGDPGRLVLAGESAGANLVTALSLCASYRRDEPWARALFDREVRPRAVVASCGILQVSDPDRFARKRRLPPWLLDRVHEVTEAYLPGAAEAALADPLLLLEAGLAPDRPLPPFFASVGTRDLLLDDTRRLKAALDRLGVPCEARYYPGEVHAFQALVFRKAARHCWRETYAFLDQHLRR